MPLKLLVLDWDGTLANSVDKIVKCKQFLAQKYNLPSPSEEKVKSVLGMKFEEALGLCFPGVDESTLLEVSQEFHHLMQQEAYQADLFPEAINVLSDLKKQGIILAIATSKDRKELDKAIAYHGLSSLINMSCCGKEYQEKPHPAMLLALMVQFHVKPEECLMVGDTTIDIQFATNAKVNAVAVTFGAHSEEKLQTMKPLALISKWTQLLEVINKPCHLEQESHSLSLLA